MFIEKEMQAARLCAPAFSVAKLLNSGAASEGMQSAITAAAVVPAQRKLRAVTQAARRAHQQHTKPLYSPSALHMTIVHHTQVFSLLESRFYSLTCVVDEHMLSAPHQLMRCSCSMSGLQQQGDVGR